MANADIVQNIETVEVTQKGEIEPTVEQAAPPYGMAQPAPAYHMGHPGQQYGMAQPGPAYGVGQPVVPYGNQPTVIMQPPVHSVITRGTVVSVSPAAAEVQLPYPQGMRGWTTGLFDCFSDMGVCLTGWFCPEILGFQVSSHMGENCCVYCCCGPLVLRTKLRTMLGIRGDVCNDFFALCCCHQCAMCQMEREMKNRGM